MESRQEVDHYKEASRQIESALINFRVIAAQLRIIVLRTEDLAIMEMQEQLIKASMLATSKEIILSRYSIQAYTMVSSPCTKCHECNQNQFH